MVKLRKKKLVKITVDNLAPPYKDYEYFKDCDQLPFRYQANIFDMVNAWWLSEAALLSYAAEEFARPWFEKAGFDDLFFFSGHSTQCYVAAARDLAMVAFRGTECGLDQGPETTYMSWLPLFHDLGLIGTMLQTVQVGTRCVFMAPMSFLRKPVRWLRAVTRHRAAISGGPNFAFDLCLRKVSEEMMEQLDLSQWSRAFCGAEPVRAETLQRFTRRFDACGFQASAWWPCYGLAEATLFVSGSRVVAEPLVVHVRKDALEKGRIALEPESGPETRSLVACGHAWPGWDVAIIDPATRCRCGSDEVGEIWLRGPSSAGAYWRRPEISRETFEATIEPDEEGPYLRTGDLGFVSQGELVITGRIKDLIIMNGQNHYPHDIELTVERCHQAFRPGGSAAFSVDDGQAERLVVVTEVDRRYRPPGGSADGTDCPILDPALARGAVRSAVVAGHDLFVHELVLIRAGALPKTSSGKVQRRATQAAFLEGSLSLWDA